MRESARPLPPPGSPNVLLIVMDTVAAGHLGMHGYSRATSTTLTELADRGIRFDSARAASSWTLPSHASMFTGRWLHELSVGWLTPLDQKHPTLAEFLGDRGLRDGWIRRQYILLRFQRGTGPRLYAIPGFHLPRADRTQDGRAGQSSAGRLPDDRLFHRRLAGVCRGSSLCRTRLASDGHRSQGGRGSQSRATWLAHWPHAIGSAVFRFLELLRRSLSLSTPQGRLHRFGVEPADDYHRVLIQHWWEIDKTTVSPDGIAFATDAYDDCIADLDEQLGMLVDELDRCGIMEKTWLIITADHGESFGEHPGVFIHGGSLYDTELHVPLLIIPPAGSARRKTVSEPVSLRDLAATIVESTGSASGSPFPGDSLSRFWTDGSPSLPPKGIVIPHSAGGGRSQQSGQA